MFQLPRHRGPAARLGLAIACQAGALHRHRLGLQAGPPLDADAVAKQHALDNLSREIRVQVQSTSTTRTLQVNEWLSESFTYSSESTTNEDLEGFTLVDTYASDTEVFAFTN